MTHFGEECSIWILHHLEFHVAVLGGIQCEPWVLDVLGGASTFVMVDIGRRTSGMGPKVRPFLRPGEGLQHLYLGKATGGWRAVFFLQKCRDLNNVSLLISGGGLKGRSKETVVFFSDFQAFNTKVCGFLFTVELQHLKMSRLEVTELWVSECFLALFPEVLTDLPQKLRFMRFLTRQSAGATEFCSILDG